MPPSSAIDLVIEPQPRDLGDFTVRRVLPQIARQIVGSFVFFDHMGPVVFPSGGGIDVRPHPHIGLATVTYLFEGEIMHRDSLGTVQAIAAGDVNWMVAGSGIAHSERTRSELRAAGQHLHGIQSWVALPKADEEAPASFVHHPKASLPMHELPGAKLRVIAGTAYGLTSPVAVYSPTLYVDADLQSGARIDLPDDHEERAAYVARGKIKIGEREFCEGQMAVFHPGASVKLEALAPSRVMLLGGAKLDGERHLWWNFVSSSKDRIEQAKRDWRAGRFGQVPGETEFIPLPQH
ncbi:MAG: pirin family protein [Rhodospirillales bacterium]